MAPMSFVTDVNKVFASILKAVQDGQEDLLSSYEKERENLALCVSQLHHHKAVTDLQRRKYNQQGRKLLQMFEENRNLNGTVRCLSEEVQGLKSQVVQLQLLTTELQDQVCQKQAPESSSPTSVTDLPEEELQASESSSPSSVADLPEEELQACEFLFELSESESEEKLPALTHAAPKKAVEVPQASESSSPTGPTSVTDRPEEASESSSPTGPTSVTDLPEEGEVGSSSSRCDRCEVDPQPLQPGEHLPALPCATDICPSVSGQTSTCWSSDSNGPEGDAQSSSPSSSREVGAGIGPKFFHLPANDPAEQEEAADVTEGSCTVWDVEAGVFVPADEWCLKASTEVDRSPLREDGQDGLPIPDLWPTLLKFLRVADVVKLQTRAVSSYFSSSKVWVHHLFELMDLDSLPEHCSGDGKHPGVQYRQYLLALNSHLFDRAPAIQHAAESEGFEGYRCWFNGLSIWHKLHPEMSIQFVQKLNHLLFCGQHAQVHTGNQLSNAVVAQGLRGLRLPIVDGILEVLRVKGLRKHNYVQALLRLECCQSVYKHLSNDFILEVLNIATSWEDVELCHDTIFKLAVIMDAIVKDAGDARLAVRSLHAVQTAKAKGCTDDLEAAKQNFVALLRTRSQNEHRE